MMKTIPFAAVALDASSVCILHVKYIQMLSIQVYVVSILCGCLVHPVCAEVQAFETQIHEACT